MQEKNNQPETSSGGQSKKSFMFGLIVGVAVIAVIGFFVMLGLYLNQQNKNVASRGADKPSVAENQPSQGNKNIQLQPISDKDWVRGDRNAEISIIEFSDTECPFCKRHHPTLQKIVAAYPGKVNWVYRHFPLASLHSKSPKEAEATECAGELGGNDGFWKYLDRLFEITPSNNGLNVSQLPQIAQDIGLDRAKFESCLSSGRHAGKVQDDLNQATAAGARGTPFNVIVVGDKKIPVPGAVPFAQFKSIIDSLLK